MEKKMNTRILKQIFVIALAMMVTLTIVSSRVFGQDKADKQSADLLKEEQGNTLDNETGINGRLAFMADTGAGFQIYTMKPNGNDLRQLTFVNGEAKYPDWSPDGERIVFEHDQDTANICADVAIMNADGSHIFDLLQPSPTICEGDPSFTPDGKRIVFERFNIDTGTDAIWSMKVNGTDRKRIVDPWPNGFVYDPNISPDGQTISFVGEGTLVGPPPRFDSAKGLFTVNISGSNLSQLMPFTSDIAIKQDWAPNGRHIVLGTNANFFIPGESANIATIRPDGTGLRYLTNYTGGDVNAFVGSYSPDGRYIVFRLEDHGSYALFRMNADGSDLRLIFGFSNFRPRGIDWGRRSSGENDDDDRN
jgi:Tol biopolymer transport system component